MVTRRHTRAAVALWLGMCVLLACVNSQPNATLVGHGKPLGAHMKPLGATVIGKFSSPPVFYGHFVKGSKPIHMKNALTEAKHPWEKWTDDYLREQFGNEVVRVELGKKETRNRNADWMRFSQFLDHYAWRDLYMVHSISGPFMDLVLIPPTLQCGGFQRSLQEAVMWMGQGPLKSVLHYDELDNLFCVFDGTKDIVLIDQFYREKVESRGFDHAGHFSYLDPEAVDMKKFRQFQDIPWYRVHLEPGDCVYIPYRWYHQVSSYGNRSLAINIWFSHLWWFDDDSCEDKTPSKLLPLHKFGFASPNEATRSRWLEAFEGADDDITLSDFIKHLARGSEDHKKKLFQMIDDDAGGTLSWEELYMFSMDQALRLFPDVFDMNTQLHLDNTDSALSEPLAPQADIHEKVQASEDMHVSLHVDSVPSQPHAFIDEDVSSSGIQSQQGESGNLHRQTSEKSDMQTRENVRDDLHAQGDQNSNTQMHKPVDLHVAKDMSEQQTVDSISGGDSCDVSKDDGVCDRKDTVSDLGQEKDNDHSDKENTVAEDATDKHSAHTEL